MRDTARAWVGRFAAPGLVLLVIAGVFAPAANFHFVNWDDDLHVYRNPLVIGGRPAPLAERLLTPELGYPAPLVVASYRLEHALFGLAPRPYHLTNLFLHLAVCGLVFVIARRLGLGRFGSAVALALFGLHPVVAEPVSWVSGRKELLAALFGLGSLLCLLGEPKPWRAALLFAAAALCKPVVLLLPAMAFILVWRIDRHGARRALVVGLPLAAIALVVGIAAFLGEQRVHALRAVSLGSALREIWYALGYHLGLLTFVQTPLPKHIPPMLPPPFEPAVDLLPLVAVALAVAVAHRADRATRVGALWAAATYLPASGLMPLTRYLADSYLYLPLAGLAWIAGRIAERAPASVTPRLRVALVATLAFVLAPRALSAALPFRDGITLWRAVAAHYPDSPEVCRQLGNAYNEAADYPRALATYRECAARFGPEPYERNIAITLYQLDHLDEARAAFEAIARARPGDPVVAKYLGLLSH